MIDQQTLIEHLGEGRRTSIYGMSPICQLYYMTFLNPQNSSLRYVLLSLGDHWTYLGLISLLAK